MSSGEALVVRSGTVCLIGRSNVGKSTLLNAALEMPLAIVSRKPQTTRERMLGVVRHRFKKRTAAEICFLDTPGLHKASSRLGEAMNRSARQAAREADVVVFVTALPRKKQATIEPHRGDVSLLAELKDSDKPLVLVVNKVDLLADKELLFPLIQGYAELCSPTAVVPISALKENGVRRVLDEIAGLLPKGEARFSEDEMTDRPLKFFAAEYVREPILTATSEEVPHAVAVTVERFAEKMNGGIDIEATIHVEREGQKRILVGQKGSMIKKVGTQARLRIEALVEAPVNLRLFVRVTENWRDLPARLRDFGLEGAASAALPRAALDEAKRALSEEDPS
ncbi:MAG: GTPase Era [Myxococcota bacterium]